MKILISGSTGLIGTRVIELLSADFAFVPMLQSEVDITDADSVKRFVEETDFDILLHLAGYTNVDGAEKDRELCRKVNVDGTRNLFEASTQKGARMIYISTDFVFSGKIEPDGSKPTYTEGSSPDPISYYGQTKFEGEQIVKDQAMIVRLSYPYRKEFEPKRDFVRTIQYLLAQKREIRMVKDSLITPTFIDDIVKGLEHLIRHYSTTIYHLVGADSLSPFEAGRLIAHNGGLDEDLIQPTTYAEYFKGKALRPQWARIVNTNVPNIMNSFTRGLKMLSWEV